MKKILLLFLLLLSCFAYAQSSNNYYNPKDDQYRLLGLKRAKAAFELAQKEFDRKKVEFEKKMLSNAEYERAQNIFSDAEVTYQQALLAVIFEKQYVSVIEAVKFQARDGKKHVRLKLANTSEGGGEFKKLINIDDKLFNSLQPEVVNNIYVSLVNDKGAIISQPYEAKIQEIRTGTPATVDFVILQDVDEVSVSLIYGNGTTRSAKIFLQKDISENKVILQSEQFSQEVELGKSATFNMTLELFSGTSNTYKLEVVNLPKQITSYFVDAVTTAKLSQFKFQQASETKKVGLQVYLPDRATEDMVIDKPMTFYALVIPYDKLESFGNLRDKKFTKEEIEKMNVGYVKLDLTPKGAGKLNVRAQQLFFSTESNDKITVPVDVVNEGTKRLDNVEFEIEVPINWTKEVNPKIVESVGVREEKKVEFIFTPPADISPGKYEIRVKTTSLSENQLVKAEDKTISIEIKQPVNIFSTIIIVLLIIGVVAGMVIYGLKLTRR
jgi:uncharacterized membrane protein